MVGRRGLLATSLTGDGILFFLAVLCSLRGGQLHFFFLVLQGRRVGLSGRCVRFGILALFLFASLPTLSSQLLCGGWLLLVLVGVLGVLSRGPPGSSGLAGYLGRSRLRSRNLSCILVFLLLLGALLAQSLGSARVSSAVEITALLILWNLLLNRKVMLVLGLR